MTSQMEQEALSFTVLMGTIGVNRLKQINSFVLTPW